MSVVLEYVRISLLKILCASIGFLAGHKLTDHVADDAELSPDRRTLRLKFRFCGEKHLLELPFDPMAVEPSQFTVYDNDGKFIATAGITVPGLEAVYFSRDYQSLYHRREVGFVEKKDLFAD